MWTIADAVGWLAELGIGPGGVVDVDMLVVAGPGIGFPEMPDRVAVLTISPGGGLFMGEGQFDRAEFELAVRGRQGDPLDAQRLALAADRVILAAPTSVELPGGTYLLSVNRGARPAPADRGNDGDRTTFTATYTLEINDEEV